MSGPCVVVSSNSGNLYTYVGFCSLPEATLWAAMYLPGFDYRVHRHYTPCGQVIPATALSLSMTMQ